MLIPLLTMSILPPWRSLPCQLWQASYAAIAINPEVRKVLSTTSVGGAKQG